MKYNRERVMQVMYINYEEEKNTLSFQTSPTKIVGKGFGYFHPDYIYTDYEKKLLNIPINDFDSVSLIRLNEYLKSLEFRKLISESGNNCCLRDIIKINQNNSEANRITVNIVCEGIKKTRIYQGLNEEIIYNSIDEFREIIKYGGTYIFEIKFKIIGTQTLLPVSIIDFGEITYGITLCVDQVYIIKSSDQVIENH